MKPLKVVYDTNILVSAYLFGGQPTVALELARHQKVVLLQSTDTVAEFIRVLGYRKFGLTAEEIQPFVEDLLTFSEQLSVNDALKRTKEDPSDNVFLALAQQGHAKYIVSGDSHLLNVKSFSEAEILSVRQFLSKLKRIFNR